MAEKKGNSPGPRLEPSQEVLLVEKEHLGLGVTYMVLDYLSELRNSDNPDLTLKKVHADALAKLQPNVTSDIYRDMHKAAYIFLSRKSKRFHIRVR